jgi:hypothetical protein
VSSEDAAKQRAPSRECRQGPEGKRVVSAKIDAGDSDGQGKRPGHVRETRAGPHAYAPIEGDPRLPVQRYVAEEHARQNPDAHCDRVCEPILHDPLLCGGTATTQEPGHAPRGTIHCSV